MVRVIRVEDLAIESEPEDYATGRVLYSSGDWCGEYNEDRTMRYLVWRDSGDDREYPEQRGDWYPVEHLLTLTH